MREPPTPTSGTELLSWARRLCDYLRENRVEAGPGLSLRRTGSGSILSTPPTRPAERTAVPLRLVQSRPPYMPMPGSPMEEGATRIWVEWGTLADLLASNWDAYHDVTATTYFFAKATLPANGAFRVTSWEIVTGPAANSHVTEEWPLGAARPTSAVYLLGVALVQDGAVSVNNTGGGSLVLTEHISGIEPGDGYGDVRYAKQLIFTRQNY